MSKRLLKVLSILLFICIVISIGLIFCIKEGKKIAKRPAADITVKRSEDKIVFTSPKSEDIYFVYDITSQKVKKYNTRPDIPIDIRDCKDAGDYFYTQKYKYTLSGSSIIKTELSSLKETPIEVYNAEKDKTVFAYSASDFTVEDEIIYFTIFFAQTKYLCRYDGESDTIKSIDITGASAYRLYNDEIYVFGLKETFTGYDENSKAFLNYKNNFLIYDTQLNFKRDFEFISKDYINNYVFCNEHICVLEYSLISLYSLNGEKISEMPLSGRLSYIYTSKDKNEHYFFDNSYEGIVKYSSDFKVKTVVCERLINSEHKFVVWPMPKYTEKDGIIYFTVSSSWAGDDSVAFCKLDENGRVVTLLKEKKHFLRNFFKSDFK